MIIVWIILICWGIWLLLPHISKWLMKLLQKKMQQQMFRQMGIDPDAFSNKSRSNRHSESRQQKQKAHKARGNKKIIPADYGDYISFTILAITGEEAWLDTSGSPIYVSYNETQISDAVWTEIKHEKA